MFLHNVYFWLRDDLTAAERQQFIDGVHAIRDIDAVAQGYVGVPATTDRAVIDRSYSYALVLAFADADAHEAYQVHPVHDRFREECASLWTRVQIYDSVTDDA